MTNAERYRFADFTRANYARLVALARQTYRFRRFWDFDRAERFVLWRHDIDFSPQGAVKLAQIENDAGVAATYFVSFHSDFYNLLEPDVVHCIRRIVDLGHDVALHVDLAAMTKEAGAFEETLQHESGWLTRVSGAPCRAFSFHNPDARAAAYRDGEYAGLVNAASAYFYSHVGFCSDSNGIWRGRRLEDVLRAADDGRLQVLTHPENWQDTVMSPRERVHRCIDGRAERTRSRYHALLERHGRSSVDW
jgi:hypothetical protein